MKSTQAIGKPIKGVTKAMGPMNRQMNLSTLQKRMQELERQNERMEMASEVIGDAIDDSLEGDEEDDETEEVTEELVNQVLDEIGIKANDQVFLFFHFISIHGDFHCMVLFSVILLAGWPTVA